MKQIVAGPAARALLTLQQRHTGDVEGFLILQPADTASKVDFSFGSSLTSSSGEAVRGVWRRVPGALKRPVQCYWYRFVLEKETTQMRVQVRAAGLAEDVQLPPVRDIPCEQLVVTEDAELATSGLLRVGKTSVIRLTPSSAGTLALPPIRVISSSQLVLGSSVVDDAGSRSSVLTAEGVPEQLSLELEVA